MVEWGVEGQLDQICSGHRVYWVFVVLGGNVQLVGPCNLSFTILPLYESVDFQEPLGRDGSELGVCQR